MHQQQLKLLLLLYYYMFMLKRVHPLHAAVWTSATAYDEHDKM